MLLTGHSHQAWPDVAKIGQLRAFEIAARDVDDKWGAVFAVQDELRAHIGRRIGCAPSELAFAGNTHELVTRFLSALPLRKRPRIVTTTGEFHAAFRQLSRLSEEEGIEVDFVEAEPSATLAERVAARVDDRTSAVVMSTVLFGTASIVPSIEVVLEKAARTGTEVLLDAYHAFDIVPFTVPARAFLVAGGYKYAQWGEGSCFMRVPEGCSMRPVYTGWFAGFGELAHAREGAVGYAKDGATRFAGSTFDPTPFFRALEVARFFEEQALDVEALRAASLRQTSRILAHRVTKKLAVATPLEDGRRGGFVALRAGDAARATSIVEALRKADIFTDSRGEMLRLGPAPYVTDAEIDRALDVLETLV